MGGCGRKLRDDLHERRAGGALIGLRGGAQQLAGGLVVKFVGGKQRVELAQRQDSGRSRSGRRGAK